MSGCYLMVAYGADPTFLSACDQTLQIVLRACRFITPTFMLIALLYTVGRGFLSGHGLSMDWGPILKAVWIFFLLFFYKELIDTLSSGSPISPGSLPPRTARRLPRRWARPSAAPRPSRRKRWSSKGWTKSATC